MQKITKALFLGACLSITTSSLIAMKEKEKVKDSHEEPLVRVVSESTMIPFYEPSPFKTFFRENWLPIAGFTAVTAYSIYDKQIRLETLAWSKNILQSLPKFVIGLIGTGILCKVCTYLFNKQPLCNNPEHNRYVTMETFAPYKELLDRGIKTQKVQQELIKIMYNEQAMSNLDKNPGIMLSIQQLSTTNPDKAIEMIEQLKSGNVEYATDFPTQQELGDLFNSDRENRTKKQQPIEEKPD